MSKRHPGSRHHARLNARRWVAIRRFVFERDGWRCVECGGAGALECHHITPLEREPGQDPYDPNGLETRCRDCHVREHNPPRPGVAAWRALVHERAAD